MCSELLKVWVVLVKLLVSVVGVFIFVCVFWMVLIVWFSVMLVDRLNEIVIVGNWFWWLMDR